jgi:FdhE protein
MLIDTTDAIVRRLKKIVEDSPNLQETALFYEAVLSVLHDADLYVSPVVISAEEARYTMEKRLPLLSNLDISIEIDALQDLMIKLAHALECAAEENQSHPHGSARRIKLAIEQGGLEIAALLPHILSGNNEPIVSSARSHDLDSALFTRLLQNAVKPVFYACRRYVTTVAAGLPWSMGFCFVCGAAPVLAELQGNDQTKHLRCGQCGADWVFRRLECVYCGNVDHNSQHVMYREHELIKMHVEVCNNCMGYHKVITSFSPTPSAMLSVEDLATQHLDAIALERGYRRHPVR